jgi:hypothetical protein
MTENVKHVEVLRKVVKLLQNTPALQGREHDSLGIAFNKAIDYFAQREAAGDGEGWVVDVERKIVEALACLEVGPDHKPVVALRDALQLIRTNSKLCDNPSGEWCKACRATGLSHCSDPVHCGGMQPMTHHAGCQHTTPASAEPGEITDADVDRAVYAFNTHRRNHPEQWNEAMRAALATLACRPDARGGGEAWSPLINYVWTFYVIQTDRGAVTIRWLGESNGWYGESPYFEMTKEPTP